MTTNLTQGKPEIPSSWQFQMLAEASLDAANAAFAECTRRDERFASRDSTTKSTFMSITVAFLYLRSVELSLKAAILERALAPPKAIPSNELGHDITKLIDRATNAGGSGVSPFTLADLGMDQAGKDFLEHYSSDYANKWFEYHFEPWDIPDLNRCQGVATSIIETIRPLARTRPDPPILTA